MGADGDMIIHGADYYPEQWLHVPGALEHDIEAAVDANMNAVTLGVFAWSMLEPEEGVFDFEWLDDAITRFARAGIQTVLATPSGARPPWLAQKYPEVLRTLEDGRRARYGDRHNHCPTSAVYREMVARIDQKLAEAFGSRDEVILWHISNEYQGTCYCQQCATAYREWLRLEHQDDLDLLNERWWGTFWSHRYTDWDQIEPPYSHGERNLHGQVIDWKRFVTDRIVDFADMEIRSVRKYDRITPTTVNLMGLHDSFDAAKLVTRVDYVSGDIYPAWGSPGGADDGMAHVVPGNGDLFRNYAFVLAYYRGLSAVAGAVTHSGAVPPGGGEVEADRGTHPTDGTAAYPRPWLLMESTPTTTNWAPSGTPKRPGAHLMASLAAIAGGAGSIQYFQFRQSRGGHEQFHGAVVDHEGRRGRAFSEVAELGEILKGINGFGWQWDRAGGSTGRPQHHQSIPSSSAGPAAAARAARAAGAAGPTGAARPTGAAGAAASAKPARIAAVVFDTTSRWMINQASGPRNDGNRAEIETAMRHFHILEALGVHCDVIPSSAPLEPYSLLVLPMTAHIDEDFATRIQQFVETGGTVVATYFIAVFDRWQRLETGGYPAGRLGLSDLFGIEVTERDQLPAGRSVDIAWDDGVKPVTTGYHYCEIVKANPGSRVRVHARYDGEFYRGTPVVTEHVLPSNSGGGDDAVDAGSAWYLAARQDDAGLEQTYRRVLSGRWSESGVTGTAAAGGAADTSVKTAAGQSEASDTHLPVGVHLMIREVAGENSDIRAWVFLFNPKEDATSVKMSVVRNRVRTQTGRDGRSLRLVVSSNARIVGDGHTDRTVAMDPWSVVVFTASPSPSSSVDW